MALKPDTKLMNAVARRIANLTMQEWAALPRPKRIPFMHAATRAISTVLKFQGLTETSKSQEVAKAGSMPRTPTNEKR